MSRPAPRLAHALHGRGHAIPDSIIARSKDKQTIKALYRRLAACLAALQPEDRLESGSLIYRGKKAEHVAEQMHMLGIMLQSALERKDTASVRKIKAEIERLYRLCSRALRMPR